MPSKHRSPKKDRRLPEEIQAAIIQRIEDRRAELDMTLDQVVERVGIGRSAFYYYKDNKRPLDMDTMRQFELALSMPAGELLKMAGRLPAGIEDFAKDPGAVMVAIEHDPQLSKSEREALRRVYESYVSAPRPAPRPSTGRRSEAS